MAKTEAEFLYKIGLVKTCLMEIDLAQSVTKLTQEFTDVGNELADMLFGVKCQTNLDIACSLRNSFRASVDIKNHGGRALFG